MENDLNSLIKLIQYYILVSTTSAGSGHPTSSLSATEVMATLFFDGYLKVDLDNFGYKNNDRVIFSKGHASPLFYALYGASGKLTEAELKTLRQFDSILEGHPTPRFPFTEVSTGSLGQGLGVGLGMALNAKAENLDYKTWVLLGDSEMAEGSVWEAMELASYHKTDNLVAIVDVNRLGQRGETMAGHETEKLTSKAIAFGWEAIVIDGHDVEDIRSALDIVIKNEGKKPKMIIAKTFKGNGISFLEDKDNWHGKALNEEQLKQALSEIGEVDNSLVGKIASPNEIKETVEIKPRDYQKAEYKLGDSVAVRQAYGNALLKSFETNQDIVVLDAETSNSTFAETFKKVYPERFWEMFIAEQNMVSTGLGMGKRGKVPFCSTFAAFLSRAFDQIRMAQYSDPNLKLVGSHAGVSIGEDGSSQMALEDLSMTRSVHGMTVFYPSDAVSTEKLVKISADTKGLFYIRTTRANTPVIYENNEEFKIGGSKTIKSSSEDQVTVVGAGITLHEAVKASEVLEKEGIKIRVIDLYSIKPIDLETLLKAGKETKAIITVEDHYKEGGIFGAVSEALASEEIKVYGLYVDKIARSGKPAELLNWMGIDSEGIVKKVKEIL